MLSNNSLIGVIGSGAMGSAIAQVAAKAGHEVLLYDSNKEALVRSESQVKISLSKLVEKQKISAGEKDKILKNITYSSSLQAFAGCDLIIEAIVENLEVKCSLFSQLEEICGDHCILASNTSSLSITSIGSACKKPGRMLGIHFFNPATIMPLVEIIPGIATENTVKDTCKTLIESWGKITVLAKDTPGFIVNRVARPFYSEALRMYEEGIADIASIDWAMKEIGGFKMGPFELMDMIGHDVNYVVTETVWKQLYFDPRFKPALSQKRLLEGGMLGKKTGKGFYNYNDESSWPLPNKDPQTANKIFFRILVMLINEAADTLYLGVASAKDIDLAMTKGVNYPKGLLQWADELGIQFVINELNVLMDFYQEDRYRTSPLLKRKLSSDTFFTR